MTLRPGSPRLPDTTRSMCSHMLGTQLVRGDGVSGLLSATLGEQDGEHSLATILNCAAIFA